MKVDVASSPMTRQEFKAIREQLEMTQADLAVRLRISVRNITRMESGASAISRVVDWAMRYLVLMGGQFVEEPHWSPLPEVAAGGDSQTIQEFLEKMTEAEVKKFLGKHEVPEHLWAVVPEVIDSKYKDLKMTK